MTALPAQPHRLLTVADYVALPENGEVRYELQEGNLIVSPSPVPEHRICIDELRHQLRDQIPVEAARCPTPTSTRSSRPRGVRASSDGPTSWWSVEVGGASATNVGDRPAPYGSGQHPYLSPHAVGRPAALNGAAGPAGAVAYLRSLPRPRPGAVPAVRREP